MKMHDYISASNEKVNDYENSQIFLERKADSKIDDSYYIYVGPRSEKELIKYNSQDKNEWNLVNMKFNLALQKNFLSISWIETAIKWMLTTINKFSKNWGVSIIILTILIKLLLFPLNNKSAMGTLKMQEIQPKMQELQTKYANDQQKLSLEMQKLYKEVGYNPMSGCLPMILQMVILFSMYAVFNNHFEFRGASFIPGWIDDLSNPDSVYSWEKKIFLISGFTNNNIRALPIVYTLSQLLNGKITQFGGSASATNKGQMKFMTYGIPIIFFFLFYNIPSGLLLYWTVSNILQIGQQLIINNVMKKKRMEMEKNKPEVNKNVLKFKGGKKKTR
jgi:YidC/Oxa1 family membrane protein insertase